MSNTQEKIEVIEANRLIAEFMGGRLYEHEDYLNKIRLWVEYPNKTKPPNDSDNIHSVDNLKYHTSWGWLMPVVFKIADSSPDHEFVIESGRTFTSARRRHLDDGRSTEWNDGGPDDRIRPVYQACVDFIQWYNSKPK